MKYTRETETRLLEALRQELGLFGKIREMTEKQTELIAADDIEGFDESLDRRQELIEKINGLHQETQALMQSYIAYSKSPGGGKRSEVEAAMKQRMDMIAKCSERNDKNTEAAKEKKKEYTDKIDKLNLNRKSLGSYIQTVENAPELFDKKM